MNPWKGVWTLDSYEHAVDELPLVDGQTQPADIESWLQGLTSESYHGLACTGLQIAIEGDRFHEQATAFSELMFDIEGVQVNDYQPMSGRIHTIQEVGFLMPDGVPEYALPDVQETMAVRYDDGDTQVGDTIRIRDERLIRQVSVITDELYLERIILIYRRGAEE